MDPIKLYKLLFLGLFFVALLSGCSLSSGEEDVIKISPPPTVKNQFTPLTVWSSSIGCGVGDFYSNLHPAFAKNTVYAADRTGTVCAFNADNGKVVWSTFLSKKNGWFSRNSALLSSGITVSGAHIYMGSENAQVYALNVRDGSVAWQVQVTGEVLSHPVVSNGVVLIHTSNGQLQALNETDGTVKWTINLDTPYFSLRGESAPAVAFGTAIVGSDKGLVVAVLIQNGRKLWQQRISEVTGSTEIARLSDVDTTPVIVDDVVYALAYNGNLTALDLYSGQIIWKRKLGSVNDFIVNSNRIYLVDQNDRLLALSIEGGVVLWTQNDLLHRLLTAPALHNNNLVVGDSEGYVHWIDLETGCFVAQQKFDSSGFLADPIVAGDKLLIQTKKGTLYAITR